MSKSLNIVSAALVPLVVAGTCLACPAAMATTVLPADTSSTAAPDGASAQAQEGTVISKGGLQVTVPTDFTVDESDDFCVIAMSADGNIVAYIADVALDTMPTDPAEIQALLDEVSNSAIEENGGAVVDKAVGQLTDGTEVYVYFYAVTLDGAEYGTYLVYLPREDGFSFAQLAAPVNLDDEGLAVFEAIVDSLLPASSLTVPEGFVAAQADGLAFAVPADFTDAGDGSWVNAEADFMLGSLGMMTDGASALTDEDYEQLTEALSSELGNVQQSAVIDANGISFKALSFTASENGMNFTGIVAFVPNKADELIGLICLAQDDGTYTDAADVAEVFFTSVTVL